MYGPYRIIKNAPYDLRRKDTGTTLNLYKDGVALGAATNAPAETPAASTVYYNQLTVAEMGGDHLFCKGNAGTVNSDVFLIPEPAFDSGVAQAGSASTITLRAAAPSFNLTGSLIEIVRGTGKDQRPRFISAYDTVTKIASVRPDWGTTPDNTTVYIVTPLTDVNVFRLDGDEYSLQVLSELYKAGYKTSTFAVGSDTQTMKTNATGYGTNNMRFEALVFLGVTNYGIMRKITSYDNVTGDIVIYPPVATAPGNGERFAMLGVVG